MEFLFKITIIIFLTIIFIYPATKAQEIDLNICKYLLSNSIGNKCELESYTQYRKTAKKCVCNDLNVNLTLTNSIFQALQKKLDDYLLLNIYFRLKKPTLIDGKFSIFDQDQFKKSKILASYYFLKVKGFDLNSFPKSYSSLTNRDFYFYESTFMFFSNGRALKTCKNFLESQKQVKPRSLFHAFYSNQSTLTYFCFQKTKYNPTCPLVFSNTEINVLRLDQMIMTFYKSNILTFLDLPIENRTNLNANVYSLEFYNCEKLKLNSEIINPYVFKHTVGLTLLGEVISIEKGTFKSLKSLKNIIISFIILRKLFHKGIGWVLDLNSNIRVNFSDNSALIRKLNQSSSSFVVILVYRHVRKLSEGISNRIVREMYPEEDFCIFVKFPFEQLVVISDSLFLTVNNDLQRMTCTYVWLIQYYPILPRAAFDKYWINFYKSNKSFYLIQEIQRLVKKCNFFQR